jgi:predicted TIM-barrel fold metal-dependent hydrolase
MTDNHLHVGQFHETYYEPLEVMNIATEAGVTGAVYSSTTSAKDGVLYKEVEGEIAKVVTHYDSKRFKPFLWYIPPYIDEGVNAENAFANLPYAGIKLHPRAHRWDLSDAKHLDCLHALFGFAHEHELPVLIHTGVDDFERPSFFESFFQPYQNAQIILAHCRPAEEAIAMFRKYPNLRGDTAFLPVDSFNLIDKAGFVDRLQFGTDFPVTHYFCGDKSKTLKVKYLEDLANFASFCGLEKL